jgi:hypothetical protein
MEMSTPRASYGTHPNRIPPKVTIPLINMAGQALLQFLRAFPTERPWYLCNGTLERGGTGEYYLRKTDMEEDLSYLNVSRSLGYRYHYIWTMIVAEANQLQRLGIVQDPRRPAEPYLLKLSHSHHHQESLLPIA